MSDSKVALSPALRAKVNKVLALARNGGTEAEAQAALLAAQRLLVERGGMSADEAAQYAEMTPEAQEKPGVYWLVVEPIKAKRLGMNSWRLNLGNLIADNFRCYAALNPTVGLLFYGAPADVLLAEQAYTAARRAAERLCNEFMASPVGEGAVQRTMQPPALLYPTYSLGWHYVQADAAKPPQDRASAQRAVRGSFYAGFTHGLAMRFLRQRHEHPEFGLILVPDADVRAARDAVSSTGEYMPRDETGAAAAAAKDATALQAGANAGYSHTAQAALAP